MLSIHPSGEPERRSIAGSLSRSRKKPGEEKRASPPPSPHSLFIRFFLLDRIDRIGSFFRARTEVRDAYVRNGRINQKYETLPAEFRHIYGGGNSMIHIPGRAVIVNISIRSIPTTHAHADELDGALREFRAHLTGAAMRPASCCYLFAHYITLLPSRVSPPNLHYKCR